ncbi:MAG: DoxX family protein [Winogradskyella sp.]|uniref:DoxX family protein n=1 Tax=Winogradskyella sp. TaxID=1883156 RepID=UPI001833BCA3|nr:DoxX family protein [Winogradskyella sp.]MBT8243636.1 DoxX family protein [Winogradskyella sp.]NNK22961.1 DoxX family protein [Winogradskyella sp.]
MLIKKIIYWLATAILCGIMLYSAQMYFINTEMVEGLFESFNYPTYYVIPLAVLKVLGVIMILWRKSRWLTEWAYAGFFFDLVLAYMAHHYANDGQEIFALIALIAIFPSYFLGKYIRD